MLPTDRLVLPLLAALLASLPVPGVAQAPPQEERVAASFVLALGRTATASELEQWAKLGPLPLADLTARHRRQLQADAGTGRAVGIKANQDAYGRAPGENEEASPATGDTYTALMQRHLVRLASDRAEYERVVQRAYRLVLQRDAYSVEIDYWNRRPVLSFALLAGCIDDWARRNRPGLTATTGVPAVSVNSGYLATVRLSPAVAAEARAAAGLQPSDSWWLATAAGRTVVAPGAEQVVSVGGIHFAAAGAASLASAPRKD